MLNEEKNKIFIEEDLFDKGDSLKNYYTKSSIYFQEVILIKEADNDSIEIESNK